MRHGDDEHEAHADRSARSPCGSCATGCAGGAAAPAGIASARPYRVGVLALDHVIVVVADLDSAAGRLYREHGLASVAGGRHAGHGTGNRIVPLGSTYIELMAVVDPDEAASSPVGSWVGQRVIEV